MSKVELKGPGYFEVQRAKFIIVILLFCCVVPGQNTEGVTSEPLSFKWVVGVHCNSPPLKAWTQTELELKT